MSSDGRLGPVLARMVQPSPSDRFASAHQVREAMWGGMPGIGAVVSVGAPRSMAVEVIALVAARWVVGDQVNFLYQAAEDYDSVIISTC